MLNKFFSSLSGTFERSGNSLKNSLAVDLGTANILIVKDDKVVLNQPSIIAFDNNTKDVIAVGVDAAPMNGKNSIDISVIRPLKDGVIADFHAAEQMISHFIKLVSTNNSRFIPKSYQMLISIPSGITEVEKRAVRDSALHAGASDVMMIYEPIAAAIGIGLAVDEPLGSMIVDIGGGTSEIAIMALSGIVSDRSVRIAGDTFTLDIMEYVRRRHNLLIGEQTAEALKKAVGSAVINLENDAPEDFCIRGRDLLTGTPRVVSISYSETAHAIEKSLSKIEAAIMKALEDAPPELAGDIYDAGIYLTGGGALLRGLEKRLSDKTKVRVKVAEDPITAVVRGTGKVIKDLRKFNKVLIR